MVTVGPLLSHKEWKVAAAQPCKEARQQRIHWPLICTTGFNQSLNITKYVRLPPIMTESCNLCSVKKWIRKSYHQMFRRGMPLLFYYPSQTSVDKHFCRPASRTVGFSLRLKNSGHVITFLWLCENFAKHWSRDAIWLFLTLHRQIPGESFLFSFDTFCIFRSCLPKRS